SLDVKSLTSGDYRLNLKVLGGDLVFQSHLTANTSMSQIQETILKNLYIYKHIDQTLFVISNARESDSKLKSNLVAYQMIFNNSLEVEFEMLFNNSQSQDKYSYEESLINHQKEFDKKFEDRF